MSDYIEDNYKTDSIIIKNMQNVVSEMDMSFSNLAYQQVNNKKRQVEIDRYYASLYDRQLWVVKKAVFICCLGLIGCILFQNGLMSDTTFILYQSLLLSAGFIVILYDLWDIYLRDNTIFDEYDFSVFADPHVYNGTVDVSFNSIQLAYQPVSC